MISDNTGRDLDEVARDIERDKFLTADQAIEYGIIDEILPSLKVA
jgi:ATP-dependent Clp protease protease subunit